MCFLGETKPSSTSTRCGVRRLAVDEFVHSQQAPRKLHEQTWAGFLNNQGLKFSQELEIMRGCAVAVARPSCPDDSLVSPGAGRVIRNMLGWSLLEKTEGSRVWMFRSPLNGENIFFFLRSGRLGKEEIVPHSVVGPL